MDQLRPSLDGNSQIISAPAANTFSISDPPPVQNSTTREYDIENIKPENKLFTVDLMGDDADVKFAQVKTPDARPDVNNNSTSYINPAPGTNNNSGSMPTPGQLIKSRDELRSGVKAAIMVVDYVISLIAMKIAGDTRQNAHTADTSQKKLLEDVIVEYLFGKQQAMPLWLTLVFAIAGSYGLILFAAIRQRNQINKNKKLSSPKDEPRAEYREPTLSRTEPIQKHESPSKWKQESPSKYNPQAGSSQSSSSGYMTKEQLTLNKAYADKNKDGVMEPQDTRSFSEVIQPERPKSSASYPDKDLIADSAIHLRALVAKGIYPMYKKNLNGKPIKVMYNENGLPKMAGRPGKLIKRK